MSRAARRLPVVAGNWKMHGTAAETRALLGRLLPLVAGVADREIVVAPPFTALAAAAEALAGSNVALAAQNVHWEDKGAFTGEVAAPMLREIGCRWVIVGHSERRQLFGETDEGVGRRLRAALRGGLRVIACVGETWPEREAGETTRVVERQLGAALLDLDPAGIRGVSIAYEPVWAIGTGKTATPDQAEEVHRAIRALVVRQFGDRTAEETRILYGGSVKADNIDALMAEPDLDGALVGGASLDAESFARIVRFEGGKR
jgi:triosephosphate isomerase